MLSPSIAGTVADVARGGQSEEVKRCQRLPYSYELDGHMIRIAVVNSGRLALDRSGYGRGPEIN